jgi:RNA polymerase sigma-70 factor, ECF subfamily
MAMVAPRIAGLARALAQLAEEREPRAWALLVEAAGMEMSQIARRITGDPVLGDDAVQEALLQIRDGAETFRVRTADPDADAWRWIMRVTSNAALSLLRRQRRQRQRDLLPQPPDEMAGGAPTEADFEHTEQADQVRSELAELPEVTRLAIVMDCVEGLGYEQVAAELGLPVGTAKTRVHRGLRHLRERLTRLGCVLSLTALGSVLRELPASTAPVAKTAWLPLLAAEQISTLGALGTATPITSTFGVIMSVKASLGIAVTLLAVALPVVLAIHGAEEQVTPVPAPFVPGDPRPVPTALAKQLDQLVTLDFQDSPFEEMINHLRAISGLNINALAREAGYSSITLKVEAMPLRNVVRWVAKLAATTCTIRDEDILFGDQSGLDAGMQGTPTPAMAAKLEQRLSAEFSDSDLADAIGFLRQATQLNVVISPQLKPHAISLRLKDLSAKRAFELVAQATSASVSIEEGAIFFTPTAIPKE